jgi:hypothetical protein
MEPCVAVDSDDVLHGGDGQGGTRSHVRLLPAPRYTINNIGPVLANHWEFHGRQVKEGMRYKRQT